MTPEDEKKKVLEAFDEGVSPIFEGEYYSYFFKKDDIKLIRAALVIASLTPAKVDGDEVGGLSNIFSMRLHPERKARIHTKKTLSIY